jgi:hypothetical protein
MLAYIRHFWISAADLSGNVIAYLPSSIPGSEVDFSLVDLYIFRCLS